MKKLITLILVLFLPLSLLAQFNLGNKIRNKVNQRVDKKIDKAIDKTLDNAEKAAEKEPAGATAPATEEENPTAAGENTSKRASLNSYSKFDFVPGERVIFYDDMAKSRLGEFPDFWLTNGMGQTVKLEQYPGQWLQLSRNSRYAPDKDFQFPQDYTIEFDLIMLAPENQTLGSLELKLVSLDKDKDNPMAAWNYDHTTVKLHQSWNSSTFNLSDSKTKINNSYSSDALFKKRGTPIHVSIAVNGTRYRLWLDEQKIYDVPQLLPKGAKHSHFFLETHLTKDDPEYQVYLTNFRVADGRPDLRKALAEEGRFITRGITFDSGSDVLKPESYGTLREIASILQEDNSLRIRIIGHTDSDGTPEGNLELSKRRALAIKTALTTTHNIAADRMETDGKGASVPIDKNETAEGKANNRRAEFVKL